MSNELLQLRKEIDALKARNRRVEADKAWETSLIRKLFLLFTTYVLVALIFVVAGEDRPFLKASIPALGYLISTFSLKYFKKLWIKG